MTLQIASGIDLVEISRFRNLNPEIWKRFYRRVFSEEERAYIGTSFEKAAGIFSAKEAVAKALGCGIGIITWQDIIVRHGEAGNPQINFGKKATALVAQLGIISWSISISHTRTSACAVAVALLQDQSTGSSITNS
jgi:holo-[acyl-carrier protein] synthase